MCNKNYSKLCSIHLSPVFLFFGYGQWSCNVTLSTSSSYFCHQVPNHHIFTTFTISNSKWVSKLWNCFLKQSTSSFLSVICSAFELTILREKPSMPPWITNPQLTKLWSPSICQRLYFLLLIKAAHLRSELVGSIRTNVLATFSCWTRKPKFCKCPNARDRLAVGPCTCLKC